MRKMMMRCWISVVMDKDQNIRFQYDEKNIVSCCPGMKYGNLKKWTTKKILKSQYRLSSISIYVHIRNILLMLIRCYQQFARGKIRIKIPNKNNITCRGDNTACLSLI